MPETLLPMLYHTHHSQEADDLSFWLAWAHQQGGPVLELGCGSGRILLPMVEAGYVVVGLDFDAQMLSFLQSQLSKTMRERVTLLQADVRHYALETRFPLIIFPCNTYSTLDVPDQQLVMGRVREHLSENGIFIVSMPNPFLLANLPPTGENEIEASFAHPQTGDSVQVSSQWQRSDNRLLFEWHYDQLFADGKVERHTLSSGHYLRDVDDILKDFIQSELDVVSLFGDYDQSQFYDHAPHLIITAKK